MTDGNSEEVTHGGDEDEAAWLDLVGRFDAPDTFTGTLPPWPDRENIAVAGRPAPKTPADGATPDGSTSNDSAPNDSAPNDAAPNDSAFSGGAPDGTAPGGSAADGNPDTPPPGERRSGGSIVVWRSDVPGGPSRTGSGPGGSASPPGPRPMGPRDSPPSNLDEEEHYIPPPPPPLPNLSPVAKGAWVALFGGPGYLIVATLAGWTISGLAMFLAVAAFIAGFTVLVLHLGDGSDRDGDDDGAVV